MNDGLQSLVERIEESLSAEMPPEEKLLVMNRESFRYFERNHFFLDVIQRVEFSGPVDWFSSVLRRPGADAGVLPRSFASSRREDRVFA